MKYATYSTNFSIHRRGKYWRGVWYDAGRRKETSAQSEEELKKKLRRIARDRGDRTITLTGAEYDRYMEWKSKQESSPSVDEAVDRYLSECIDGRSLSKQYVNDVHRFLGAFSGSCNVHLSTLTHAIIMDHVKHLGGSETTQWNRWNAINSFIKWAVDHGMMEPLKGRPRMSKPKPERISIYTPEQIEEIIAAWPEEDLIMLYLGGAFGVRTSEIFRMTADSLKEGGIVLDGGETKTGNRRVIPYLHVGRDRMLELCEMRGGEVYGRKTALGVQFSKIASRVGVPWITNGLRHSWCSYQLAISENVDQTALYAGNSRGMLYNHYLAMATKDDAERYFATFI